MRTAPKFFAVSLGLLVASAPSWASAQDDNRDDYGSEDVGPATRPSSSSNIIIDRPGAGYGNGFNISLLGTLGSYGNTFGLGVGGLAGIPIVAEGFIPTLNDSFHLEFGAFTHASFYEYGEDGFYLSPVAGVRWDFNILRSFTAFLALRGGISIPLSRYSADAYFDAALGGFWRFSDLMALRFEFGGGVVGTGVSGGLAFFF